MAERALDPQLSREARHTLVVSIVVEALHALRTGEAPAIPERRITQLLRRIDDEARTAAAGVLSDFVEHLQEGANHTMPANEGAARVFHSAPEPFLRRIWPQERSLSTPGTSRALSDLPASSGSAFADAVAAIEPFLVAFDCWSLMEYGFRERDSGGLRLDVVVDEASAQALLGLLDLTIGASEGAIVPRDLALALSKIADVTPKLAATPTFRRLATAARGPRHPPSLRGAVPLWPEPASEVSILPWLRRDGGLARRSSLWAMADGKWHRPGCAHVLIRRHS